MPLKFTDLHIVIDSHLCPDPGSREEEAVTDTILDIIQNKLNSPAGYMAAIPADDPSKFKSAIMLNAAIERGDKYGRLHAHANVSLIHRTKINLKEANEHLAEWFDKQTPWPTKCFASVKLLPSSRAKNYNAKAGRVLAQIAVESDSD